MPTGAPPSVNETAPPSIFDSVGASLADVILTVVSPFACKAPPLPCDPLLLSSNVQARDTLAGGASLELLYCNDRIT